MFLGMTKSIVQMVVIFFFRSGPYCTYSSCLRHFGGSLSFVQSEVLKCEVTKFEGIASASVVSLLLGA